MRPISDQFYDDDVDEEDEDEDEDDESSPLSTQKEEIKVSKLPCPTRVRSYPPRDFRLRLPN